MTDKPRLTPEAIAALEAAGQPDATPTETARDVICPFCREPGFNLIGLKNHLSVFGCTAFEDTPNYEEPH